MAPRETPTSMSQKNAKIFFPASALAHFAGQSRRRAPLLCCAKLRDGSMLEAALRDTAARSTPILVEVPPLLFESRRLFDQENIRLL